MIKIKIPAILSSVETPKERKNTQEKVDEERQHLVEVCLLSPACAAPVSLTLITVVFGADHEK